MKTINKSWTIIDILKTATEYFSKRNIESPRLNAERLLSSVLNIDRLQLYIQFERILTSAEQNNYRELVQRRSTHEPLQYILGETEFMGLPIKVNPDVLIPRPETEILVEKVLDLKEHFGDRTVSILDIGTGSGCIAISLAHYWQNSKISAIDVSQAALDIAVNNSIINNVSNRIDFLNYDILNADILPISAADIIVSNPPYVSSKEFQNLDPEIRNFEPEIALTDGADGILFYKRVLKLIEKGFQCKFVFMELNTVQTDKIKNLIYSYGFTDISVIQDLNNLPRVLKIEI